MTFSKSHKPAAQAPDSRPAEGTVEFESLFQQHWERICRVIYRVVGDWAEAEDLALDAFYRLYRRPPSKDKNLGGWLYRVATNLGYNALRARKRRRKYEEEAGNQLLEQEPDDPADLIEKAQERQAVRHTLERMKLRSAQLLILRHSGLSYAEIAEALDLSPASIGTLLARAEKEFEKKFER